MYISTHIIYVCAYINISYSVTVHFLYQRKLFFIRAKILFYPLTALMAIISTDIHNLTFQDKEQCSNHSFLGWQGISWILIPPPPAPNIFTSFLS